MAGWKPLLDKYEISAVMVEPSDAPATYRKLMQSQNWVPFYDDGRIVMFGRADAPATDLAFFKANKLDADLLRVSHESSDCRCGAAAKPDLLDRRRFSESNLEPAAVAHRIGRCAGSWGRATRRRQPAERSKPAIPDPARCILAIQEARTALAHSPDDWIAFRRLKDAYRYLMIQENAMLAGVPITPENSDRI